MDIKIIGVHPIETDEPCHLIEVEIQRFGSDFNIGLITQEILGQPQDNWQVPYDEHFLNSDGTLDLNKDNPDEVPKDERLRVAFFFHYLDFSKPMKTSTGDLTLPEPVEKPIL